MIGTLYPRGPQQVDAIEAIRRAFSYLPRHTAHPSLSKESPKMEVKKSDIESRIKHVRYVRIPESTVTICNITLDNGFSVRGESACVDPAKFNEQYGRTLAYDEAFDNIYKFFGFLLMEAAHQAKRDLTFGGALKALKEGKRISRKGAANAFRLKDGKLYHDFLGGTTESTSLHVDALLAEDYVVVA